MSIAINLPPSSYLKELFKYDKKTGNLYWNARRCGTWPGRLAGTDNDKGYRRIKINGRLFLAHRVVWKMHTGCDPVGFEIDHIDRNPMNNRIDNLRIATHGQNKINGNVYRNNDAGYRGVHFHKQHRKYCATISHNKKRHHIGLFDSAHEAASAYDAAAKKLFGEFANTNLG